jgi:hypothetical protein
MPISQTVVINIVVKGSTAAVNANLQQTTQVATQAANSITTTTSSLKGFAATIENVVMRQINTLVKAITSMIGVMAIYTAMITIPEMLAKGLIGIAKAALQSADAVMQTKITITALIASVMDFGASAEESFSKAVRWADVIYLKFVRLSAQSVLTTEEMLTGYQAFLAGGGAQLTKSLDDQVKISGLLSQAIFTLTGRVGVAKQQFSEMRALLAGSNVAGAQLVKWLANTEEVMKAGGIKKWIEGIKTGKISVAEITKLLGAFIEAGKAQGETLSGLITSITDFAEVLNAIAVKGGVFRQLSSFFLQVRDTLGAANTELTEAKNTTNELTKPTQQVVDAFATFNATLQVTLTLLMQAVGLVIDIKDPALAIEQISHGILVAVATLSAYIHGFYNLLSKVKSLIDVLYNGFMTIVQSVKLLFNLLDRRDSQKEGGPRLAANLKAYKEITAALKTYWEETKKAHAETENFLTDSKTFDVEGFKVAFIKRAEVLSKGLADAIRKGLLMPAGAEPNAKIIPEVMTNEQIKALERARQTLRDMREEYALLIFKGNDIAEILIKQYYAAEKLKLQLKDQPVVLEQTLALLKRITAEEVKQATIKNAYEIGKIKTDYWENLSSMRYDARIKAENDLQSAYKTALNKTVSAVATAETTIQQLWANIVNDTVAKDARLLPILVSLIDRFNEVAESIRRAAQFKDFINGIDVLVERSRILNSTLHETLTKFELAWLGFGDWKDVLKEVTKNLSDMRIAIEANNKAIETLRYLAAFASGEALEKLLERIRQLTKENRQLEKSFLDTLDALANIMFAAPDAEQAIRRLMAALLSLDKTIDIAKLALSSVGALMAEAIAGLVSGAESIGKLLKRIFASILQSLASFIIGKGIAAIASGGWPPDPIAIRAGLAMIAAGGVLMGLAAKLGGGGGDNTAAGRSAGSGSTSSSSNSQTIYLEPYFQRQDAIFAKINGTMTKLDATISSFSTKSPGVLVKEGVNAAGVGGDVTRIVTNTLKVDTSARVNMMKTVNGEGY